MADAKLIRRAKKGDKQALTLLYEQYVDRIYRYIAYRVPEEEAEDITADVFVRMVESLPRYEPTGAPFESWLYRIAAARVADHHRRNRRQPTVALVDDIKDDETLPEAKLVGQEEVADLREALRRLPTDYQQVLLLRFVERKTHDEVASIMGKTVSAVKNVQHRALKELTRLLGSEAKVKHYFRGTDD